MTSNKMKLPTWAILLIAFFVLGLLGNIIGGLAKKDKAAEPVATTAKQLTDDEKRQAENERKIAEAQKEYDQVHPKPEKEITNTDNSSTNDVINTDTKEMDFDSCLALQSSMESAISPNYKSLHLVTSETMSVVRFCTNDGSVLSTCSKLDNKSVTIQSKSKQGCD